MKFQEVMTELESLGTEQTKKTLLRHGAVEPLFGVKVGDMKSLRKILNNNHEIALELYATGNSDAMYLAGLVADQKKVTKAELNRWVKEATWSLISGTAVAALAAESKHGFDLAQKWIDSQNELIAAAGWHTLTHWLSIVDNDKVDLDEIRGLLKRVSLEIHAELNQVKSAMNGFLIAAGSYFPELTGLTKTLAREIGKIKVDKGDTSCKTPDALAYIEKIEKMNRVGKKRKSARC
ncbi:MAG: DNA alkylation repair protein [Akkermansiaceae bacterium]